MNEISEMSDQTISGDTLNAISSPELRDGATPYDSQAGPTTDPAGPGVVPASLSARQAKEMGLLTSGTFGQRGSISSNTRDQVRFLANRLMRRSAEAGSTLFRLTWRESVTNCFQPYCLLRASALRTSGTDCGSWPTPVANDDNKTPEAHLRMKTQMGERDGTGANRTAITSLQVMARMASWPSPTTPSGGQTWPEGTVNLENLARLVGWPTSRETDGEKNVRTLEGSMKEMERKGGPQDLNQAATLALTSWPTPQSRTPSQNGYNEAGNSDYERKCEMIMGLRETVNGPKAGWPTPNLPTGGAKLQEHFDAHRGNGSGRSSPVSGFWADAEWLWCRDQKYRPVEPGTFPLASGISGRVGRLRGYGNSIVPAVAAEFISAYMSLIDG